MSQKETTFPEQFNMADYFLFDRLEEGYGGKPVILFGERTYTYEDVAERSRGLARYFQSIGVTREQRIYTVLPDTPPFAWSFYGTLRHGAVVAMGNPHAPRDDLEYVINYAHPPVVVTLPETADDLSETLIENPFVDAVLLVPDVETGADPEADVDVPDALAGSDLDVRTVHEAIQVGREADLPDLPPTHRDDIAAWLFTAGSTGRSKAAMHTHRDFAFNTEVYAKETVGFGEDDVTVSVPNLYFGYATGTNLMFPFAVGATVGLYSERPTPESIGNAIEEYDPTIVTNVPTMLSKLLDYDDSLREEASEGLDMDSVRFHISAGEALPPALLSRFRERFGNEVYDGIGSAEMFHIYATNRPGDVQPGSLGKIVEGYDIRILPVDAEGPGAEEVPEGETGEMWVKGDSVALGYFKDREESWDTFYGHWCRTGDLFCRDEDGYFWFGGRADNMFKASGIWVAPLEVEECLVEHEAVGMAAVIPAEKEEGLVKPKAFVELREEYSEKVVDDEEKAMALREELQQHVKESISKHKYPRWVVFTEDLPKNDRGKVDRKTLEEREEAGENPWK